MTMNRLADVYDRSMSEAADRRKDGTRLELLLGVEDLEAAAKREGVTVAEYLRRRIEELREQGMKIVWARYEGDGGLEHLG